MNTHPNVVFDSQTYREAEKDFVGARNLDLGRSLNPPADLPRLLDAHKEQLRPGDTLSPAPDLAPATPKIPRQIVGRR
jgi:hypothetical protein